MGTGGVVGASTLGVAMFSLLAPEGHLNAFTAVVPVVNCMSNFSTVSVYVKHASWKVCMRMWPFILLGIVAGQLLLPWIPEPMLRRLTSVIYGVVLLQRVTEKLMEQRQRSNTEIEDSEVTEQRNKLYQSLPMTVFVSVLCGVITVVTNNSGPIFNIYLLACGLNMDQFVATRSVIMAGKNVAKVAARVAAGGLPLPVFFHGIQVGLLCLIGIQVAKPIKRRTSTEFYTYFTWCVLLYTCVRMWIQ